MSQHHSKSERGQSMVIISVLLLVLIGLSALVLDGGLGYAKRRQAQNAADAAALAGADLLCGGYGVTAARQAATDYLLANGANNPSIGDIVITDNYDSDGNGVIDIFDKDITVTAYVSHPTFFAGIFGAEEITANATASAGCYTPCSAIVLPLAWACKPPVGQPMQDMCGIQWTTLGDPNPTIYLIMDDLKLPSDIADACQDPSTGLPTNGLDCDMDNDGINELLYGGERSWLDLDGGGGGGLENWIDDGFDYPLYPHMWFAAEEGVMANLFQAAADRVGDTVIIPVYDIFCESDPRVTGSGCTWHSTEDIFPGDDIGWPFDSENPLQTHFHIISYSYFHITCVEAPSVNVTCPGKAAAQTFFENLYGDPIIANNTSTIEGYFVQDYGGEGACTGTYAGAYTIYLK